MSNYYHFPAFMQWIQSITLIIIAAFGYFIAYHQMISARIKLQHDLFDRRYDIYLCVRKFIVGILDNNRVCSEDIFEFKSESLKSVFLFDKNITDYISTLINKAEHLLKIEIDSFESSVEEHIDWFEKQEDIIHVIFRPYLNVPVLPSIGLFSFLEKRKRSFDYS